MAVQSEFTIDELARAADTTVRSVRVYHERGLLPSPDVRGRVGYYGSDHLNRLQTISRLLSRGMKLNGIRELLDAWDRGDGLADVLGVSEPSPSDTPTTPFTAVPDSGPDQRAPELPEYIQQVLDTSNDPLDAYQLTNPRCSDLATRLVEAGLSTTASFQLVEQLRGACDQIADWYASELFYCLARQSYEESERTPKDRRKLESDLAIARLITTRAASELLDQAFARYAEVPPQETADTH
ncbi:MerR family transcriptional regulator [Nocardia wallacei]|uniref:MerR family transcriptional regulator n=1 Tax=Nocardia wallacei TaxID=480035 RepID=UPI0024588D14|nr:MerR family transcriptional regulator [Nocardia wallacei]